MRFGRYILFFGFIIIIFSFGILSFASQDRKTSYFENRVLAKNPKIDAKSVWSGEYFKQYENYFADQFYGRDNWVKNYTILQMKTKPIYANDFYITKDNYILKKPDKSLPKKVLDTSAIHVNELGNYLANQGTKLYYFSLPSKRIMLSPSLPVYVPKGNYEEDKDYFLSKLQPEVVSIVDLRPSLEEKYDYETIRKMYFKTDHHWNIKGAMFGYEKIIETISNDFDSISKDYTPSNYSYSCLKEYDFIGSWNRQLFMQVNAEGDQVCYYEPTTYSFDDYKVYLNGVKPENEINYSSIYATIKNKEKKVGAYAEAYTGDLPEFNIVNPYSKNDLKVLVLKDSYMNPLSFYIAHHFKETTIYDMRYNPTRTVYDYLKSHDFDVVMIAYNDGNLGGNGMYDFKSTIKK